MRAYIHAFQGRPWNEECQAAYDGFISLGIECVLFTTNEELDGRAGEDIVVGGMLIMNHSFAELGIQLPDYNYRKSFAVIWEEGSGRSGWAIFCRKGFPYSSSRRKKRRRKESS